MSLRRYQATLNRQQDMLLPPRVEEYVGPHNPVRAIDAYVNTLDLAALGFKNAQAATGAGQPPFDPAALLKLYLYGYLQGLRSSRKLERETYRNLEVIWLVEGVRPSYRTLADFRQGNSEGLKAVNRDFMLVCKELALLGGEEVAVDGSFFKANASKDSIYTEGHLDASLQALEAKITAYQQALAEQDAADDQAGRGSLVEDPLLTEKLEALRKKQKEKQALRDRLKAGGDKQISTVDADARLLSKRGQSVAGYNVQLVVDDKHKLIVAEAVTQDGNDLQQLSAMLNQAQEILGSEHLTGLADSGYFEGNQLKSCEDQDFTVYVAIPDKSKAVAAEGRLTREQFTYEAEQDHYRCPQGHLLSRCGKPRQKNAKWRMRYQSRPADCKDCLLREQCLTEKARFRQLYRWEHEAVIERHRARMAQRPDVMKKRAALAEHPFGVLKHRAGMHHFLMRGLKKCRGELSLMVLGYNFTRVLNMLGIGALRDYCARRSGNTLGYAV
jgi:transposase